MHRESQGDHLSVSLRPLCALCVTPVSRYDDQEDHGQGLAFPFPVHVMTKSDLVLRDLHLLQRLFRPVPTLYGP